MKWFPPMAAVSPSPMVVMTVSSGRIILMPVAKARTRPWVVCIVLKSRMKGVRLEQPIPPTTITSSFLSLRASIAWTSALTTTPLPQPGHQTLGSFSTRK